MTFWIIQGETDFCMTKWEEIIYNMMVGIIYVFCWFGVREGPTRCRLALYSLVVLVENVALTTAWFLHRGPRTSDFHAVVVVCCVACSYALGTFFMFVYYCLLHPDGHVTGGPGGAGILGCCVVEDSAVAPLETQVASPASTGGGGAATPGLPHPHPPPPDLVASPPRTLQRTKGAEQAGVDGDVFQVRPSARGSGSATGTFSRRTPAQRLTPRTEGPVIRIDLPRKQYPAWDAHFIDRRLRKTILVLERAAPATPRIQYRCLGTPTELMEYETTV